MSKFFRLIAFLSLVLIASLSATALFHTRAVAQEYPGCFMVTESRGVVDLSRLCADQTQTATPKLVFGNLKSNLILGNAVAEVKGTVTNSSNQIVPITNIYFQLVANNRVISSGAVEVAREDGLKPGESLTFEKVISKSDLGNVSPSAIQVQVIRFD